MRGRYSIRFYTRVPYTARLFGLAIAHDLSGEFLSAPSLILLPASDSKMLIRFFSMTIMVLATNLWRKVKEKLAGGPDSSVWLNTDAVVFSS